jgi:hypothetical protein
MTGKSEVASGRPNTGVRDPYQGPGIAAPAPLEKDFVVMPPVPLKQR